MVAKPIAFLTEVFNDDNKSLGYIAHTKFVHDSFPVYTLPPKPQGLTDEEIKAELYKLYPTAGWTYTYFARAIEAKLMEKNT